MTLSQLCSSCCTQTVAKNVSIRQGHTTGLVNTDTVSYCVAKAGIEVSVYAILASCLCTLNTGIPAVFCRVSLYSPNQLQICNQGRRDGSVVRRTV